MAIDILGRLDAIKGSASAIMAWVGGLLIAAPIDWTTFDFKTVTVNQVVAGVVWVVIWHASRIAKQPAVVAKLEAVRAKEDAKTLADGDPLP